MSQPASPDLLRVLWIPAHPAAGAISMDRYWRELERERLRQAHEGVDWQIQCALGAPPQGHQGKGRVERAWQKYGAYPGLLRWRTAWSEIDVVHLLDHSFAHLLPCVPKKAVRKIVTVHDLAPLRDPTGLTTAQQQRFRRTVENVHCADLILADSHHSAEEATALLGVSPEKMRVLPLGVDVAQFSSRPSGADTDLPSQLAGRKVVLSVGATISRKNLEVLPAIFRQLSVDGVMLLRIGGFLPPPLLTELQAILGKDHVVELGGVPDATLVQAYQRADALIFPSLIEGFGFPVLEAMAACCPVVCTNVTSLPEVGGEAASYFSPGDPTTAAGHLQRLLTEAEAHEAAVAAGIKQADAFSWSRHFERLLELYRSEAVAGHAIP